MDGREVGPQVAAPVFYHNSLPGQFHEPVKKRSFPWPQSNSSGYHQNQMAGSSQSNPPGNWNPNSWNWDSVRFAARPVDRPDSVQHGPYSGNTHGNQYDQQRKPEERSKLVSSPNDMELDRDEGLTLELGGRVYSGERSSLPSPVNTVPAVTVATPAQELVVRPVKRVRSGSPASGGGAVAGGGYPMCQVDDCRADLSNAKDYHRRHKVCEAHSKTTKALVGNQMQRFCQQCSRFHPLSEFDEGKRSCRRRLAGHNRRRRKTQPSDVASQLLLPSNQDSISNANLDIVNILTALARLQNNTTTTTTTNSNTEKSTNTPPTIPDRDNLIQIISKINSLNDGGAHQPPSKSPQPSGGFDLNVSEDTKQDSVVEQTPTTKNPPTQNLLAVLSSAASLAANKQIVSNSQGSSDSSGNDNAKTKPPISDGLGASLGLQLFGDESPPKVCSTTTKYLSSESSNPMEEQSPSESPPITRKFFPVHGNEGVIINNISNNNNIINNNNKEDFVPVEVSTSRGSRQPFINNNNMIYNNNNNNHNNSIGNYRNSSSGSDHSPSTSNSDAQDRTGRIVFKLFGKDPSSFPQNIRDQINNWLSSSPSSMESYIRPGCVVLSVYLSMPAFSWDELEENLLQRVTSLVECSDSDFWKNGRFLVRTNRQLVSHKDGIIRLSKSWRTWSSPEVTCVTPVAVVGGQKTALVLRGRNLTVPGTKIYCTHMGKYLSKEVLCSVYPGTIYDDSSLESFDFPGDKNQSSLSLGRRFIEVENGFKGNSFPVIVASSQICQELRTLESEFEGFGTTGEITGEETGETQTREDVLHFLNELGWLFQTTNIDDNNINTSSAQLEFSIARFKYLLIFSVERDWCVITKTLLDMLAKRSLQNETLIQESLNTVHEIHLLNRAVRRKSRKLVETLLHYTVKSNNSNAYLFVPSFAGPNGWTPLHLAASSDASADIIDALTDDPQQIGLKSWDLLKDENDQTPFMYASSRNNHKYNELVARKRLNRKYNQVSISIDADNETRSAMDRANFVSGQSGFALRITEGRERTCGWDGPGPLVRPVRRGGLIGRPYVLSMLGIAAVCVCVCVCMRGLLRINYGRSFNWEKLGHGFM